MNDHILDIKYFLLKYLHFINGVLMLVLVPVPAAGAPNNTEIMAPALAKYFNLLFKLNTREVENKIFEMLTLITFIEKTQ